MHYDSVKQTLLANPKRWLITGVAGFIGSNLLEALLELNQKVVGVDNFSTGFFSNLEQVQASVSDQQWQNFEFIEGDIGDSELCEKLTQQIDYVLHQAALGSIPRSIDNPLQTNAANITGFLNILNAAKNSQVKNFVYAASSSTYGDHPDQPRREDIIGKPLSPYAVTKYVNELYADVFYKSYQFNSIGLRYFNVFGKRQNPQGAYAAVIPKWIYAMLDNTEIVINGDGETSRDFCFIDNVIQANILAATAQPFALNKIYNVALGKRTSLLELYTEIADSLSKKSIHYQKAAVHREFRKGDIQHSQADISKIIQQLSYRPKVELKEGLDKMLPWIIEAYRG